MEHQDATRAAMGLDEAVSAASILARGSRRVIVGLVGAPGAGKSTAAALLADRVADAAGQPVPVVAMDGFHLANEVLIDLGRRDRKGAPDTFDVGGYAALLSRLRVDGGDVYAPRFDRELEESIGSAVLVPAEARLVLTEGNYLLHQAAGWSRIRPLLDEVWYLDVPRDTLDERLVARRIGHGHEPDAARAWVADVDGPNIDLVTADAFRADRILHLPDTSLANGA